MAYLLSRGRAVYFNAFIVACTAVITAFFISSGFVGAAPADKVTICHYPPGGGDPFTIEVSENALDTHIGHGANHDGDYEGECEEEEVEEATITVEKIVVNDDEGTLEVSDFTLYVDSTVVSSGEALTVSPGTYTISEDAVEGYTGTIGGDCDASGSVTVADGDSVTCTITNDDDEVIVEEEEAFITVEKIVVNDDEGSAVVEDFTLYVDSTVVTSGVALSVLPGTYTISEDNLEGYTGTFSGDCDENGSVTVVDGDAVTCTITNDDDEVIVVEEGVTSTLTVVVLITNDDEGTAVAGDVDVSVSSTVFGTQVVTGSESGTEMDMNGAYEATAPDLEGYTKTLSEECTGDLAEFDESAVCTVSYDDEEVDEEIDECSLDNLLANGSFEVTDGREGLVHENLLDALGSSSPQWDVYSTLPWAAGNSATSWYTESGAGIEIQYTGVVTDSQDGVHHVELDSHNVGSGSGTNTTMNQSVTLAGGDYVLSFWYKPRTASEGDNTINIQWDGVTVETVDGVSGTDWTEYQVGLEEQAAGTYVVGFAAAGTENALGGLIDTVSLNCGEVEDDGGDDNGGGDNGGGDNNGGGDDVTSSTLMIVVSITNDNTGTSTPSDIDVTVSSTVFGAQVVTGNASGTEMIMNGAYEATAPDLEGYTKTLSEECTGDLAEFDESAVCTVSYDDEVVDDNGGGEDEGGDDDGGGNGNPGGTSTGGGGGGSGNPPVITLVITEETLLTAETTSAVITWETDRPGTSRVVYGTYSVADSELGDGPLYGYEFTNEEDSDKVIQHSMTITGLTPGVQYYFRPVSHASPEVTGIELTTTTVAVAPQAVLGTKITDDEEAPKEVLGYKTLPVAGVDYSRYVFSLILGVAFVGAGIARRRDHISS